MNTLQKIVLGILATCIIALPICYQASTNKLFIFDEGYYFYAAYQLGEYGKFFIHFDPSSQLENTKPYLFVAFQAILGRVLGWNEWSMRTPTILSSIALIWVLYVFIYRQFKDQLWALTSAMVLLMIPYFISPHMAFTGDHDVPLVLFITCFLFLFYLFLVEENTQISSKYILWAILCATLSILTKGWMVVFFLPSCLLFLFIYKKQYFLITNNYFWIGIGASLLVILTWYLGREFLDPGYIEAVWRYEIGRYHSFVQPENPEWTYYWIELWQHQLQYWLLGCIPAAYFLVKNNDSSKRKFLCYSLGQAVFFLGLFSFSYVKLLWYDAAILPICAIIIGYGIAETIRKISHAFPFKNVLATYSIFILFFSFFYIQLFKRTFYHFNMETFGDFMLTKQTDISYTVLYSDYNPHLLFYEQRCNRVFNQKHTLKKSYMKLDVGEKILICEPVLMMNINRMYTYEKIDSLNQSMFIKIKKSRYM